MFAVISLAAMSARARRLVLLPGLRGTGSDYFSIHRTAARIRHKPVPPNKHEIKYKVPLEESAPPTMPSSVNTSPVPSLALLMEMGSGAFFGRPEARN